jgi:hypothetical protein
MNRRLAGLVGRGRQKDRRMDHRTIPLAVKSLRPAVAPKILPRVQPDRRLTQHTDCCANENRWTIWPARTTRVIAWQPVLRAAGRRFACAGAVMEVGAIRRPILMYGDGYATNVNAAGDHGSQFAYTQSKILSLFSDGCLDPSGQGSGQSRLTGSTPMGDSTMATTSSNPVSRAPACRQLSKRLRGHKSARGWARRWVKVLTGYRGPPYIREALSGDYTIIWK